MKFEKLVCCPTCKGPLETRARERPADEPPGDVSAYGCPACGVDYGVEDGVVDFLAGQNGGKKSLGQRAMESERIVGIYASRWYRASKCAPMFTWISLEEEIALVTRILGLGPADTVLDLACGPGFFAQAFAEAGPGRTVLGLDLSWTMLRYAVRKAERLGLVNLAFLHGDAHALPVKDASLDGVNCGGALHLLPDVRRVLGELNRIIRPRGRLSVTCFRRAPGVWGLLADLDGKCWGIHYFGQEELEGLLDEAGFEPTVYHARGIWMVAGGVRRP